MGVLGRIRESLSRTKQQIVDRFEDIVRQADGPGHRARAIDVGDDRGRSKSCSCPPTSRGRRRSGIIAAVKANGRSLRDLVKQEVRNVVRGGGPAAWWSRRAEVTLIVGVNGTGKNHGTVASWRTF